MFRENSSAEVFQCVGTRTRIGGILIGTIAAVRDAGISVCSGGILGLGESVEDRVGLIWEVSAYVLC